MPAFGQVDLRQGRLYTGLAEGGFVLGAVGIVSGIVLLATSGPPKPKPSSAFVGAPARRPGSAPLDLGAGRFDWRAQPRREVLI